MDLGLNGLGYVVTGGTKGLGRAAAAALAADGANVLVTGRTAPPAEELSGWGGARVHALAADNADPATPGRLVAEARGRFGRLDGLLVSVGGPPPGTVFEVGEDQWRAAFESVFLGAVRLATTFGRELAASGGGAIGFVLASSARSPLGHIAVSNGLRPGLAMVAKSLADELGASAVRVFGLAPGLIETDRLVQLQAANPEARARDEAGIPLRRIGDPEEFGRVAAFLLSPAASYVTGCVVPVDGGSLRVF